MATDPVSERLAVNVLAALATVKTSNGYTCTLNNPHRATALAEEGSVVPYGCTVWQHAVRPDNSGSVPYGQVESAHVFEIEITLPWSNNDKTPIGRLLNLARCDVERAMMADPRRGGTCFVDNYFDPPMLIEDSVAKVFGLKLFLVCQYRTLRGDPRALAPTATNELLFQGGATLQISPRLGEFMFGPWISLADVRVIPKVQPELDLVSTDAGGISRPAHEAYAAHAIRYSVEVGYINADVLVRQLGGAAGTADVQVGGTYVAVPHQVRSADSVVPLVDVTGSPVFGVTGIAAVTSADQATTYTIGTDYLADAYAMGAGMVRIPKGSMIPPCSRVLITFDAVASTRPAIAVGTACHANVRARIVWTASDGTQLVHDDPANIGFDGSLVATAATAPTGEPMGASLTLTAHDNGSATPLGRYLMPSGPKPAVGS